MEDLRFLIIGLTASLVAFAGFIFAWYFTSRARSKERLLLIEKGIDLSEFYKKTKSASYITLKKIGIIVIGFGLAYLAGQLTTPHSIIDVVGGPPSAPRINYGTGVFFVILGASVLIAHYADRPKAN